MWNGCLTANLNINHLSGKEVAQTLIATEKKKRIYRLATSLEVLDAALEKRRKVLLTVIPTREYYQVTSGIKLLDPHAFFLACDAYQVEGGK